MRFRILLLNLLLSFGVQAVTYMSHSEDGVIRPAFGLEGAYKDIREFYKAVLFPMGDASQVYYLGLGKSPGALIAFLSQLHSWASNMALSGVVPPQLSGAERENAFTYFDSVIPKKSALGKRTLVLVDMVWQGHVMRSQLPFLREFMRRFRRSVPYKVLLLRSYFGGKPECLEDLVAQKQVQLVNLSSKYHELWDLMYHQTVMEGLAEFGSYYPFTEIPKTPRPRPAYKRLEAAFLERMQKDRELLQFLKKKAPGNLEYLQSRTPAPKNLKALAEQDRVVILGEGVYR